MMSKDLDLLEEQLRKSWEEFSKRVPEKFKEGLVFDLEFPIEDTEVVDTSFIGEVLKGVYL